LGSSLPGTAGKADRPLASATDGCRRAYDGLDGSADCRSRFKPISHIISLWGLILAKFEVGRGPVPPLAVIPLPATRTGD
jgi:hypothetical protein